MEIVCPKCDKNSIIECDKSSFNDLSLQIKTTDDNIIEEWHCNRCKSKFLVYYKPISIEKIL